MVMVQPNKETIFTFDGSTNFFIVLMFFSLIFLFFSHGWIPDEICGNADEMLTSEECGGETTPPRDVSTNI